MADSLTIADEPPAKRPGLVRRLLLPLLMLLLGLAGGGALMVFAPGLLPLPSGAKPAAPKVAPLSYIEIDNSFTSNLKDSGRFIQVRIALSTNGGAPVAEAVERHRIALIAAVLGVLAETTEAELYAPGGRERLAARMRDVINATLQRKSGLAGIDDVFLTSFVVQ